MALRSDAKFKGKLTCGLENDKEFGKFSPEHSKSQNWTLIFYPK